MWTRILELLPEPIVIFYTIVAFLVPLVIYKINRKLHRFGDPPWKEDEKGVDEDA
ncbi:hypothetical protein ABRT01_07920 [Lentibacillus sp. L22]|uniref:hypothetical protein n=1 Tax=Lentibacillus TaxID=175304 RepID=UPI0022B0EC3F|nr:hypothetical protein [Lentibacillus daqui]